MYNTQEVSELNLKFKKYVSGVIIFSSVRFLSKKVSKTSFFKKNRNRFKSTWFGSIILGKKPIQTVLARFFQFGLVFSSLAQFFRFGLVFFRVFFGLGLVRFFWFQAYKTEPVGFFKF
jgi:hypothetical protein